MTRPRTLLPAVALLAGACSTPMRPPDPAPAPLLPIVHTAGRNDAAAREPRLARLENGMAVITTSIKPGSDALIQFGVLAGTMMMAPGLGELSAHVMVESGDPSQGRLALSQSIARLGGTVQVRIGPITTWFDIRVPGSRWSEALAALRAALDQPARSRNQIERIREDLVERRSKEVQQDAVGVMAQRLLLADADTSHNITDLVDRDASEIDAYVARLFRPERTLLAIEAPESQERISATLSRSGPEGIAGWRPSTAIPGEMPLLDRRFESGLHWAEGAPGGRCQVAIVMMLPDVGRPESAPLFVLQECVTLDGTGGRFEQLQRDQGLAHLRWKSDFVQSPDAVALVLRTESTAEEAVALFRTMALARASLLDVAPTPSEIELALRRAPMTARLGMLDPGARLRSQTQMMVRGTGIAAIDLAFRTIEQAGFDVDTFAAQYQNQPLAMIVVGDRPPPDLPDVRPLKLLPTELTTDPEVGTAAPTAESTSAGAQWLDRAIAAVGSKNLLRDLVGWEYEAGLRHTEAPPMRERLVWQDEGWLERDRELLGGRIEARITADARFEQLGTTKRALDLAEVAALRREQQRHPLALLAAHARGELEFRSRARRTVGDREMMVLEALGSRFDRLRIHIDTESNLLRVVEVWETLPDASVVHIEETWSDYRRTASLRVPHHRMTSQDNGQNRIETTFSRWTPSQRLR
jgi:hypothetical protein